MSRIAYCPACSAVESGVKTRIPLEHTCGLETGAVPGNKRKTWKERVAEELEKQAANAGNQQLPAKNDLALLPAEIQKEIHAFAAEQTKDLDTKDTHGMGFYCGAVAGITIGAAEYASKAIQWQQQYQEERQLRVHLQKENDILTEHYNTLQKEFTALKAQPGAVWVKASERLPAKGGKENSVIVRGVFKEFGYNEWPFVAYGYRNFNPEKQQMYFELGSKSYLTNDVEWLDESGTAASEWKTKYEEENALTEHLAEYIKQEKRVIQLVLQSRSRIFKQQADLKAKGE